jgi:hypothetical protein
MTKRRKINPLDNANRPLRGTTRMGNSVSGIGNSDMGVPAAPISGNAAQTGMGAPIGSVGSVILQNAHKKVQQKKRKKRTKSVTVRRVRIHKKG